MEQSDFFLCVCVHYYIWIKILSSDRILVEKIIRAGRMKELRPVLGSGVADFAVWWELGVNSLRIWQP